MTNASKVGYLPLFFENFGSLYHSELKSNIWHENSKYFFLYLPYNGTKLVKNTILMQMYLNQAKNRRKKFFYSHLGGGRHHFTPKGDPPPHFQLFFFGCGRAYFRFLGHAVFLWVATLKR